MRLANKDLKKKYNDIYNNNAYKNYFTFNPYDILKAIVDSVDDWTEKNVLDIGCGEGDLAAMISFAGAKHIHAIDYSDKAIDISKNRINLDNIDFQCMNGNEVTRKYDVIVMAGVLEHIDQPFDMLSSLMRDNLNKGGVIITASPSFMNPRGYVWMALQILLNVPMSLSDIHFFLPDDFKEFGEKNNYNIKNSTIAHNWGGGERTILDFKKRLVNALSDADLDNKKVPEFLNWMEKAIPYFEHTEESGAIMVTKISNN
jgi:2-polyprenyl-3-methyl-5-hydroxy-6-metoxy-1,4-benzoquinol methylase